MTAKDSLNTVNGRHSADDAALSEFFKAVDGVDHVEIHLHAGVVEVGAPMTER